MKINPKKATALVLTGALILGITAGAVSAGNADVNHSEEKKPETSVAASGTPVPMKDETVYVIAGADGTTQQVIVSNWLQNTGKADRIEDFTSLSDISNVKGYEDFVSGANGKLTWNANGNDIYYQGTTQKPLPVDLKITYTLDGKEIAPDALAGKNGRVTIRFDYRNNQFENVIINGKEEKIYVPFLMMTGVLLDTEVFRNVTVTNGKLENMGNQIAVLGIALPGMQETLNISEDTLELPQYIEITADATGFDMGPSLTIATTALLQDFTSEDFNTADLKDQAAKLTDGMNALLDGSGTLYNGLNTLLEQTKKLVNGIDQLAAGAAQLQSGANALNGGAAQLQSGAGQLAQGLETLDSNSAALNGGAQQIFETLLATANSQLSAAGLTVPTLTIQNYSQVLTDVIASLDSDAVYQTALKQVTDGVNARRGEIEAKVTAVVREQVTAQVNAKVTEQVRSRVQQGVQAKEDQFRAAVIQKATGMTVEQYDVAVAAGKVAAQQQEAVKQAVAKAMADEVSKQMESAEMKAKIAALTEENVDLQMATDEVKAMIADNTQLQIEKAINDTMASPEIQGKLAAAAEGAKSVIALKTSLDSYNTFYKGLLSYTAGVSTASGGANALLTGLGTLNGGTKELTAGIQTLNAGLKTLKDNTPALLEGITALRDGSSALKGGLNKLMDEGIRKIADLAQDDLANLFARISAAVDAANRYKTFTGIDNSADGTVKFIYKTDSTSAKKGE